jgi:hypothetical protein
MTGDAFDIYIRRVITKIRQIALAVICILGIQFGCSDKHNDNYKNDVFYGIFFHVVIVLSGWLIILTLQI